MSKLIQFGEKAEGYSIPVLNEREVRASAGILFQLMFMSLMLIIFKQNFILIKYAITSFLLDFIIRVFINPKYAPTLIIGRWIVRNQTTEYVSAAPKRFAWTIGVFLATVMFFLMVVVNSYSIITGLICLICLVFLFFESAFGICLGCLFYKWIYKSEVQYCPGEICYVKTRHEIQKTSFIQLLIVLAFVGFLVAVALIFNEKISIPPSDLFAKI